MFTGNFIATKDPEYLQLEKVFNDFSKLVDVLAQDARVFRDSIAGMSHSLQYNERKKNSEQ